MQTVWGVGYGSRRDPFCDRRRARDAHRGLLAALALRRLPTVRLQLAGLGLVAAAALPLAAVLFSGVVSFDSDHDFDILLVAAGCSTAAFGAALLVGGSIRAPSTRFAAPPPRSPAATSRRAPEDGPSELAELAASFNEMATSVEELFDARTQLVAWASHDPPDSARVDAGDAEAVEDGLVEPEHYVPELRRQVQPSDCSSTTYSSSRGSMPAC